MTKILILTAGFGEGHNTAARNIGAALSHLRPEATETRIVDLYAESSPRLNVAMQAGYRLAINRATRLWRGIFSLLDRPGPIEKSLPLVARMRDHLAQIIRDFQPDVLVSTYPLYSFLMAELRRRFDGEFDRPLVTMVTDSTEINSAWYRCASDAWIVLDEPTARRLVRGGVPEEKLRILGFPVSLVFEGLEPLPATAGPPWKILYMPSTKLRTARKRLKLMLDTEHAEVTVVTGKAKRLLSGLKNSPITKNRRCQLVGWTDQMPQLLASHHLFVGKAGGAIIQEAIAARCPTLVSHVVPGQEEGNIAIVLQHQIGALANTDDLMEQQLHAAFAEDGFRWRQWKENLESVAQPGAARRIAEFVLELAARPRAS